MFAFNDAASDVPLKTPVKLPEFLPYAIPLVEPVVFGQVPNIRGNWSFNYASDAGATAYDAAYWVYSNTKKLLSISQSPAENCVGDKAFDASRYSTIYQGNKMQSKALQTLPCIRC